MEKKNVSAVEKKRPTTSTIQLTNASITSKVSIYDIAERVEESVDHNSR